MAVTVYTIGHSTREPGEFVALLQAFGVERLVDVRTVPRSRHVPWTAFDVLPDVLTPAGISYSHLRGLGGLRKPRADSPNGGWRNESFRGYADHMASAEFQAALEALLGMAREETVAIMCAEAVPWRCHRNLVADALTARGVEVRHIMESSARPHDLPKFAKVRGDRVTYPPEGGEQSRLPLT